MKEDQLKVVLDRIDSIQKSVDQIDQDMGSDRRDMQNFAIRLGTLEVQVDEMRKAINSLPQKTANKVEDAVAPIIDEAQNLSKQIENKKTMVIREKIKPLWRRLLRR